MRRTQLFCALIAFGSVLLAFELGFRSRIAGRFLPEQTFRAAVAAGDGCVATFGDSRMVAGVVPSELTGELARRGHPSCHAALAIGGTELVAHFLTLRRYLEQAERKPRLIVLGLTLEATLEKHLPPDDLVGNEAVVLGWSSATDVTLVYPGFPFRHFDDGFRFLTNRAVSTTAYGSLIWNKTRALQDRLVQSGHAQARNRFGVIRDMDELAASFRQDLSARLSAYPERTSLHPAFTAFIAAARHRRVPVLIIELPMPSSYARTLAGIPAAERLRSELKRLSSDDRSAYVNLARPAWLDDGAFEDQLHLRREAAFSFSRDLAGAIAHTLANQSAQFSR
jgi:hypothetical protein